MTPRRILVLGGGCAGVAAAWALTRTPALRARHRVTLVQAGWRLGGKGATGRSAERGDAVLEHGLHLWLGFYRHAFAMVRDLYDAWDRPATGPQRSLEAAFSPLFDVVLRGDDRARWRLRFPRRGAAPWLDRGPVADAVASVVFATTLPNALRGGGWTLRRLAIMARLGQAVVRGLARERKRHGAAMWDHMDDHDLRGWLRLHGAGDAEVTSPPICALYDLGFAYPDGRAGSDRGAVAAGAGLRVLLQIFGAYRGAPFYRMNAGMGDTVFAPAWDVLGARGVRRLLFHRVERLRVRGREVAAIDVAVQATGAESYDPLISVGPIRAWPDRPLVDRLERVAPGDLEADDGAALSRVTWERGRDFDDVVLAIPATGHRRIAGELMAANPAFGRMVENTHGVPTIAAQWWLTRDGAMLSEHDDRGAVTTGLPGLFRTCADLTPILDAEAWSPRPAGLAYFCNVAPPELHAERDPVRGAAFVAREMRVWAGGALREVWPKFDDAAIHGGWSTAYARANVADWDRYVLTLPGTTRHRLAPDHSGFSNVWLAGDWTRNAVNGGSVEAAVSSGVAAADAIISSAATGPSQRPPDEGACATAEPQRARGG